MYKDLCTYLYPVYYIEPSENPLTTEENDLAKASWDAILKDNTPAYLARKAALENSQKEEAIQIGALTAEPLQSCKEWFTALFYERFFDVHPYAKALFSDPEAQGKFLIALFSFIFTAFDNPRAYQAKLKVDESDIFGHVCFNVSTVIIKYQSNHILIVVVLTHC